MSGECLVSVWWVSGECLVGVWWVYAVWSVSDEYASVYNYCFSLIIILFSFNQYLPEFATQHNR